MTNPVRLSALILIILASVAGWYFIDKEPANKGAEIQTTAADAPQDNPAGLSYLDIVNNPEFKEGYKKAMRQRDEEAMNTLQSKALEIARLAGLPADQLALFEGERGRHYLQFRAARQLFNDEFQKRFNGLQNIESLKMAYPQARDLFAKADELIARRDEQIVQVARDMAGQDTELAPYLEQARQQWLANVAKAAPAAQTPQ